MNDVKQDTYSIIATCVNKYVSKWNYKPALEVAVWGTFIYSSANYLLLGLIIEKVTGVLLCDYLQEKLFQQCNINMQLYPQEGININDIVKPHVYPMIIHIPKLIQVSLILFCVYLIIFVKN